MNLRRRIALFLDPPLAQPAYQPPGRLDYSYAPLREIAVELAETNRILNRMDRAKRRPRIVECQHPEMHPELVR